jgi:predicted ATPase
MWTSIAEALGVPPEGRIPPGFFDHVAHRTALLVLDNLEQVAGADEVVVELLQEASQVVVVATSRRPLNVPGELQHAVPPLELPDGDDLATAADSGAVQLFAQTARSVRSGFAVTADNVGDVVAICSRLDGLPLAIELAAARSKLLAPHALLARLDKALDLRASGVGRPSRQRTLRDTIAWSYDLLEPRQQVLFRRLGVFAGGADLDAIEAVCGELLDGEDLLDVIAELVDASLATIGESIDGEPRAGMLVTVRAFALDSRPRCSDSTSRSTTSARHWLTRSAPATRQLPRSEWRLAADCADPWDGAGSHADTWAKGAGGWSSRWPSKRTGTAWIWPITLPSWRIPSVCKAPTRAASRWRRRAWGYVAVTMTAARS